MTIQDALAAAMPGDTVTIPAGVYDVGDLSLPANVTLYAPQGATIIGNLHISGPSTVVQGFTFAGGMVDIGNSQGATIRDCVFNGGEASITFDGAADAHILNNDFNNVAGGAVDGWALNQSTISGNHFVNCTQGINLNFNNDPTAGNNIVVEQNTFTNTARMPIEVGPGGAYTSNLVIRGNWSDNSNVSNPAPDGGVAYSIISTNGVNTLIEGNYAKGPAGPGIGIEMDGSGEIKSNYIDTFDYGIIVYGSGFNVHDNAFVNTPLGTVVNYSGGEGIIQNNVDPPAPALLTDVLADGGSEAGNLALLTNYLASTFVPAAGEGTGAVVAAQSSDQAFLAKPIG